MILGQWCFSGVDGDPLASCAQLIDVEERIRNKLDMAT